MYFLPFPLPHLILRLAFQNSYRKHLLRVLAYRLSELEVIVRQPTFGRMFELKHSLRTQITH